MGFVLHMVMEHYTKLTETELINKLDTNVTYYINSINNNVNPQTKNKSKLIIDRIVDELSRRRQSAFHSAPFPS